jgi:tRNA dimethylallyltransferase
VLALVGPTASGKSALAMALARQHPGVELITVDSMQVYRGMDIGTAKPTAAEQHEVRHHLLDVADPHEDYGVTRYQAAAHTARADIVGRANIPVLVGGTGLYLRALTDGLTIPPQFPDIATTLAAEPDTASLHRRLAELDPVAAARMEPTNRRRVLRALEVTLGSGRPFSSFGPGLHTYPAVNFRIVGLAMPRAVLDARIAARYRQQLADGFLAEVDALRTNPAGLSRTARQALGYRQLLSHLEGQVSLEQAVDDAVRATRRFARRQERWFRRDPRIRWLAVDDNPMVVLPELLKHFLPCG